MNNKNLTFPTNHFINELETPLVPLLMLQDAWRNLKTITLPTSLLQLDQTRLCPGWRQPQSPQNPVRSHPWGPAGLKSSRFPWSMLGFCCGDSRRKYRALLGSDSCKKLFSVQFSLENEVNNAGNKLSNAPFGERESPQRARAHTSMHCCLGSSETAANKLIPDLQRETFSVIGIFCTMVLSLGKAAKQQ